MTVKRVVPRARASQDVENAIDHYAREAGSGVALRFVAALQAAYGMIARHPAAGSARYAHELDLPGLRHRHLARFPWLVFYVERTNYIDVWRVLDARRDLPARLGDREAGQG